MITDQNGNEISRMAFDPFGKRLTEHVGSSMLSQSAANDSSYHGHSQLDHLGLVEQIAGTVTRFPSRAAAARLLVKGLAEKAAAGYRNVRYWEVLYP